jgi:hypothetical protein
MPSNPHKADATFRRKCERVSEATGIDVIFFDDPPGNPDVFEDDGNLHIRLASGLRACFGVDPAQDGSGAGQNAKTRKVMEALGMKRKITDRVLVEEDDDEDYVERCPHCGGEL